MADGMQERKLSTRCRRLLLRLEGVVDRDLEGAFGGVVMETSNDACDDAWLLLAEAVNLDGSASLLGLPKAGCLEAMVD
eukprot:m.152549 g.152549  ORF g.152549 m.152549 type:complete len:79 (-) comp16360_c0_seq1:49-285(-)